MSGRLRSVALRGCDAEVDRILTANVGTLLAHRDPNGRFYTWFVTPGFRNDIDSVVNVNVVRYLGQRRETLPAIEFVLGLLTSGREQDSYWYYLDDLALYHAIARAGATVPRFKQCQDLLRDRIWARMRGQHDVAESDLMTALAASTMCRVSEPAALEADAGRSIDILLERQAPDGGWACEAFYAGPPPPGPRSVWFGSRELTTALAIEALALFAGTSQRLRGRRAL